jgi:aspartyl-tRNA(Asn)/glutamyl-tRNA(Gln) amidotransferase subunit B
LSRGERIVQETRLYDHEKNETRPMRSKEEANDYRYFPEPDLPPLLLSRAFIDGVQVPRLPNEISAGLLLAGVAPADARTIVADPRLAALHARLGDPKRAAHFIVGELSRALNDGEARLDALAFDPAQVAEAWALQDQGIISSTGAREVLSALIRTGEKPAHIVEERGLAQVQDSAALEAVVDAVLARYPGEAEKYKAGKKNLLGFLVGAAMKDLKGKGNPAALNALFRARLGD